MHYSPLGSSVHGISRQEYWSRVPFPSPGDLPTQGLTLRLLPCRQILYHWTTREALRALYFPPSTALTTSHEALPVVSRYCSVLHIFQFFIRATSYLGLLFPLTCELDRVAHSNSPLEALTPKMTAPKCRPYEGNGGQVRWWPVLVTTGTGDRDTKAPSPSVCS